MQVSKLKVILLTGFSIAVLGCNSSTSSNGDANLAAAGTIDFTLDGTAFTVPAKSGVTGSSAVYVRAAKALIINGIIATGMRNLQLSASGLTQTGALGAINLGGTTSGNAKATYPGSVNYMDSLSSSAARAFCTNMTSTGTLTLTQFDTTTKMASGTFSATVRKYKPDSTGTAAITVGSFTDIPITML